MRVLRFDDTLQFDGSFPAPQVSGDDCLIRVKRAGICSTDLQITRGYMGFAGVLGHEFCGVVEAGPIDWIGKRVVGEINCVCRACAMCQAGLATHCRNRTVMGIAGRDGCFADQVTLPARNLHFVPDSISDDAAVFVEPLAAAWQVLHQVRLEKRMDVVVIGSGKLGLLVAQVLRTTGCKLTVIGRNPVTLDLCDRMHLQALRASAAPQRQDRDVVVECTGSPDGLTMALGMVRPRGTIVLKSTYAGGGTFDLAPAVIHEVNILGSRCGPFPEAIDALAREAVSVHPLISRTLPLERGVEAFALAAQPDVVKVLLKVDA